MTTSPTPATTPDPSGQAPGSQGSATPATRTASTPAQPGHAPAAAEPEVVLEPGRDFGWALLVLSASSALLASWMLFPTDDPEGMSAGYWVSLFGTIALVGAAWLRVDLAPVAATGTTLLAGLGMALVGILVGDYPGLVTAVMASGGVGIAAGAAMQTARRPAEAVGTR